MTEMLLAALIVIGIILCLIGRLLIDRISNVILPTLTRELEASLTDITSSLSIAAGLARNVATDLELNVAEARQQFSRLVVLINQLQTDSTAKITADALVASDLKEVQQQARSMNESKPGEKADSAAIGTRNTKAKKKS